MPPKFGNYLFRNLKGQRAPAETPRDPAENLVAIEDRPIILRETDFLEGEPGLTALDWSKVPDGRIVVRLGDTTGLMDGRVRIKAATLRNLYPGVLPETLIPETEYPISLKTVVLQMQSFLREKSDEIIKPAGPDFDTPIAQVAREDEGFFELDAASANGAPAAGPPDAGLPDLSPASGSGIPASDPPAASRESLAFPLIREKQGRNVAPKEAPNLLVQIPRPASPSSVPARPTQSPIVPRGGSAADDADGPLEPVESGGSGSADSNASTPKKDNPFIDLPEVGPRSSQRTVGKPRLAPREGSSNVSLPPAPEMPARKPARRIGLERLQEIFMTDDYLDGVQVAKLLVRFPKVKDAKILLESGEILGGIRVEREDAVALSSATDLIGAAREFGERLHHARISAITLLGDFATSIFQEGRVCLLITHEGRGLLPGMRDRMVEIARALDALYAETPRNEAAPEAAR